MVFVEGFGGAFSHNAKHRTDGSFARCENSSGEQKLDMTKNTFAKQGCVSGAARAVVLQSETRWRSRVRGALAYGREFGDPNIHTKTPAGFL